jgi:hypothetical protein
MIFIASSAECPVKLHQTLILAPSRLCDGKVEPALVRVGGTIGQNQLQASRVGPRLSTARELFEF